MIHVLLILFIILGCLPYTATAQPGTHEIEILDSSLVFCQLLPGEQ